jgi:hypothetical protein
VRPARRRITDAEAARTFVALECRTCQGVVAVSVWRLRQCPVLCECSPNAGATSWAYDEAGRMDRPDLHRNTFQSLRVGRCLGDPPLPRYTLPDRGKNLDDVPRGTIEDQAVGDLARVRAFCGTLT